MKILRLIVAIAVTGFLLGALASAVAAFAQGTTLTTLPDLPTLLGGLSERILGPLGTAVLAALYLYRDFLPDKRVVAISAPLPPAQADAPPWTAPAPKFELKSFAPEVRPEAPGLEDAVRAMIGGGEGSTTEYSAQRFFITDATGNRRGVIGVNDEGAPLLALFTAEGNPGLVISELAGALMMGFYDSNGRLRARLSSADAAPRLALNDEDGRERVGLSVLPDGEPYFFVADQDQTVRLAFAEHSNGATAKTRL